MSLFGALEEWRRRPIDDQAPARRRKSGFRARAIERSNTYYLEDLVDLRDLGIAGENYYHTPRNPPYWRRIEGAVPDLLVRRSVGERLVRVNAVLGLAELELFVKRRALRRHDDSTVPSFSDDEARANRRLLHWVMAEAGFAGHPDEWWHYSWGDQLWAALSEVPAAHYGLAEMPTPK